jgi:hypothetical protein
MVYSLSSQLFSSCMNCTLVDFFLLAPTVKGQVTFVVETDSYMLEQRRTEMLKRPFVKMLKVAPGAAMATGRAAEAKTEEGFMLGRYTVERKPSHATYEYVYFTCLGMVEFTISG